MLPVSLRDRELYRFFERSPIGMFRCDEPGRFHYVNPALVRMLGYDSAEELEAERAYRAGWSHRNEQIEPQHSRWQYQRQRDERPDWPFQP